MTDLTLGIIYAIKGEPQGHDAAIQKFLHRYFESDYQYDRDFIDRALRQACADYITTADDPNEEVRRYFLNSNTFALIEVSEYHRMITFLTQTKVKDKNGYYINGFREMKGVK